MQEFRPGEPHSLVSGGRGETNLQVNSSIHLGNREKRGKEGKKEEKREKERKIEENRKKERKRGGKERKRQEKRGKEGEKRGKEGEDWLRGRRGKRRKESLDT